MNPNEMFLSSNIYELWDRLQQITLLAADCINSQGCVERDQIGNTIFFTSDPLVADKHQMEQEKTRITFLDLKKRAEEAEKSFLTEKTSAFTHETNIDEISAKIYEDKLNRYL